MPRRKGYGIPPTKRIKIDNEIENNENELTDVASENATNDIQKSQNENCVREPSTSSYDGYATSIIPIPVNGTKYLHKKFKKMAAILSDDCSTSVVEATDKSTIHISDSQQLPQQSCPLPAAAPAAAAPQSSLPASAPIAVLCPSRVEPAHHSPSPQQHYHQQPPHNRVPPANGLLVVAQDQLTVCQPAPSRLSTAFIAKTNPTTFPIAFCNGRTSSVSLTTVPASLPIGVAAVAPLVTPPIASATAATAVFVTSSHKSLATVAEDEAGTPVAAGRHACPYCNLVCNKPSVLQKHIRAHTNERPFPCQPCGFSFKTSSNLYKHQRSRSHTQKMEEVGADGKAVTATPAAAMVAFGGNNSGGSRCSSLSGGSGSLVEEELLMCGDEDDSQASSRDADASSESESGSSCGSNGKVAQLKKSIYKPKFHKAAIYIQNNPLGAGAVPAVSLLSSGGEHLAGVATLNKFGLQLKIPVTAGTGSRSLPSTPSPFSGSSPSPEFLQRHISKLISENQAIVETTDPFWSKKFYSRTNKESAMSAVVSCASIADTMLNAALPKKKVATTAAIAVSVTAATATMPIAIVGVEEKLANESKLAHALLQPKVAKSISMNDVSAAVEESQPLNLTMCKYVGQKTVERVVEVAAPVDVIEELPPISVVQKPIQVKIAEIKKEPATTSTVKFARPTSLPLKPGSCMPKKLLLPGSGSVLPLVSPETPRPNKSYGQLYIGGNAYTYLGLKCSTRSTFCTLHKSQPTYVPLSPEHNKISMYSNWKVRSEVDPYFPPTKAMACYDSRQRYSPYSVVYGKTKDAVTHSSYWLHRIKSSASSESGETKGNRGEENKENRAQEHQIDERRNVVESQEGTNDDEEDDEDGEDFRDDDPKSQLEREVAKSLLSLSKMSHQSVSEGYVNAGLVPLNARPNTYPYKFSALSPMSSKPHTPTLTSISEQKERESVSKNTRLAQELQTCIPSNHSVQQKGGESVVGRYYFVSPVDKDVKTTSTATTTSDLPESAGKGSVVTPVFPIVPIDLSSKTMPERRVPWTTKLPSNGPFDDVCYAATTSISEILTPVSEPVLLASICSTIDRLPPPPASAASDVTDGSSVMLQTYLKERAVQDLKIKQQYQSPHIKMDHQRDFDLKYNAYNEAFQMGASDVKSQQPVTPHHHQLHPQHRLDDRTTPSPTKRKNHFTFDGESPTEKIYVKSDRSRGAGDAESAKENYAGASAAAATAGGGNEAEKSNNDCSTSVIILVGSPNSGSATPSKRLKAEFISPSNGPLPKYASVLEDGRSKCVVCNKIFNKPSQLRLHVNIHYFEQPFRCQSCAVSFRTKGHLQKHLGSNSHLNKVSMNSTAGGQTSTNNPRPFKCDDCSVGFRIHGHLAKHLRSKMHIMKLECLGKLPFGTYAEMERCGVNMNDIDTTDCENSLESLQRIAKGVVPSAMYVNNADDEGKILINGSQY